jgi:dihydropteroate synthase
MTPPGRTLVMGIVNVTPDSFSDGGLYLSAGAAVAHGLELLAQGADLLDVGGESTRPGAERPDEAEELARVLPVVARLAAAGARVSIDTMRSGVAAAALDTGAQIVNDVSGGLADPAMFEVVAGRPGTPYVLMHWRGHGSVMNDRATYGDVVADVTAELAERVAAALAAGVAPDQLILDPGLGFAKDAEHNWALLRALPALRAMGYPLLVGASRKRFLGALMAAPDGTPGDLAVRDAATAAVSVLAAQQGAWAVRVHDVPSSVAAVRVVDRVGDRVVDRVGGPA